MEKIILYHGSDKILREPKCKLGKAYNDYGQGLYCTRHLELAKEWAVDTNRDGFVNIYELNLSGLGILNLEDKKYSILNWLTILLEHRQVNFNTPVSAEGLEYLKAHYHMDIDKYDVVTGYQADDSYFSFARAFISNSISMQQLEQTMYLGELGIQYFIKSEKAFSKLKFVEAILVNHEEYYSLKYQRDRKAREDFERISSTIDRSDIYLLDLIREESDNGTFL